MNKFTIQQLQQMRESEDRVEFKAGEGGNVSYDGRGRTNPKDRRRCILGYVIDTDNILSVNSMPRSRRISEVLQKTGLVEKSGQGVDRMFAISISEGKPIPDYSLTDEWQVCLRLHGTIQDPALLLLIHDIQRNRATTEQLNAFDLLALYRVSRGESIRNIDSVTLKKLLSQELLIETSDGIKLTPLYDEMKLRAGVTDKIEDKNVPVKTR